jgi:starch synthase
MLGAIQQAIDVYHQPDVWRRLQLNGMQQDFSWDRSAVEYAALYKQLVAAKPG